jgi:hypothetical protein
MKQIKFGNPVFHVGVNTTVRYGRKWLDLSIGEQVELTDTQNKKIVNGRVIFLHVCLFRDLPDWILKYEHDPECQNFNKLMKVMEYLYEDFDSLESEVLTIGLWIEETE